MRRWFFALCGLLAFCGFAQADSRVRNVLYDPEVVVPVAGREGFETAILFRDDERIENVAVGDSLAWQVTPNKRATILFLKPVLPGSKTNLTVVTDKRVYMFDLAPAAKPGQTLYSLKFSYSDPPVPPAASAPPQADNAAIAANLNFAWQAKGEKKLFPARIFDDGHAVYLSWGPQTDVPAILSVGPDGSEGPANYTVRGDTVVVDGELHRLVLRSGDDKATLTNHAAAKAADAVTGAKLASRLAGGTP
jgi:type IV secretion system protein VirB9